MTITPKTVSKMLKYFSPANATFCTVIWFVVLSGEMFAGRAEILCEFGVTVDAKLRSFRKLNKKQQ